MLYNSNIGDARKGKPCDLPSCRGRIARPLFRRLKGEDMISDSKLHELQALLAASDDHAFYTWGEWQRIRQSVLEMDHYECQQCRAKGRYRKATIVHHIKHLKDRPDLALSIWDGEERQLLSVCKSCHEELHPEWLRQYKPTAIPVTMERWD